MIVTEPLRLVPVPVVGVLATALRAPENSVACAYQAEPPLMVTVTVVPAPVTPDSTHSSVSDCPTRRLAFTLTNVPTGLVTDVTPGPLSFWPRIARTIVSPSVAFAGSTVTGEPLATTVANGDLTGVACALAN